MWSCIFILVKRGGTVEEWRWVGVRGTVSLDWKIEAKYGFSEIFSLQIALAHPR